MQPGDETDAPRGAEGGEEGSGRPGGVDGLLGLAIVLIEYGIVLALLGVSAVVLVRTLANFLFGGSGFPQSIIPAIDGILVVIILLDIVHTVFRHLRDATFPVRPFLVIGILAGIRDILAASARLALSSTLTTHSFDQILVELSVGVGLVVALLLGLLVLDRTDVDDDHR